MEIENTLLDLAKKIFLSGVAVVSPGNLIKNQVSRKNAHILINEHPVNLENYGNVYVVGFGKAVLPMAEELLPILHGKVKDCVLSVPVGTREAKLLDIELYRGAKNNIPDDDAFNAAKRIVQVVKSCSSRDLLFVLISGGGSALLPFPKPPITLAEKSALVKDLSRNGADIRELNVVRKKLSAVKGGGLISVCGAAQVISLILSDVLGDDLGIIASGPTVIHPVDMDTPTALEVSQKFISPISSLPQNILTALRHEAKTMEKDCENRNRNTHPCVKNMIIGNNDIALRAASAAVSTESSFTPIILTSMLDGEARLIGQKIACLCHFIAEAVLGKESLPKLQSHLESLGNELHVAPEALLALSSAVKTTAHQKGRGLCLLFGGETTVKVKGSGRGGRNQELALSAGLTLHHLGARSQILICSGGTDGIDGPCDAAGAIVTTNTISHAKAVGFEPESFLENNDSYHFFKSVADGKYHLITGHTETNVMDIVIAIISPSPIHENSMRSSL